jgi:hypothetical protein
MSAEPVTPFAMTPQKLKEVARAIRIYRRAHGADHFILALENVTINGNGLSREEREEVTDVRMANPALFKPGLGDEPPSEYAADICSCIDELDEMGRANELPPEVQKLWEAEVADIERENAEYQARVARETMLRTLGAAVRLFEWLEVQGAPVTRKQIAAYFVRPERTVRHWLETLKEKGVLEISGTYHEPLFKAVKL